MTFLGVPNPARTTQVLALGVGGRWALAADGLETLDIEGLQAR
jgi:hypothetical protein